MSGPPFPGDAEPLPRVTPFLLTHGDRLCPRRLDLDVRGQARHGDPVNRGRVRDAFLEAARTVHTLHPRIADATWPGPPPWLTPEEVRVLEQAVHWYVTLFGAREVELYDHDLTAPTELPDTDVRVGGWVDLTVVGPDGRRELRQLELWGRRPPADLLADWSVRAALVRLTDWLHDGEVTVSWTDLLHGLRCERTVAASSAVDAARVALDDRVAALRARADETAPVHGADCGTCGFHKGCPEFPRAFVLGHRRRSLLPGLLALTPSALEAWHRCPRSWRDQYLLAIPPSDDSAPSVHGQQVHDLLRLLHAAGPCDDPDRIDDVVAAHGASARVHAELTDHARRCPIGAQSFGHEITRARLHHKAPGFVATARIDAAWIHDGLLDVRDYKTGGTSTERVADDQRARLQAWVMGPVADRLGLQLRIRYEQLAAEIVDDPEEWEPDADDLDRIGQELVATVTAMRDDASWVGVADAGICGYCRYRSICTDSATPGVPGWPRVEIDVQEPETTEAS
jgi:hypothetical protein